MIKRKRPAAAVLSLLLCFQMSAAAVPAVSPDAEVSPGTSVPSDSVASQGTSDSSAEKEEVVYVRLGSDGSPANTYVVNIFSGGDITDYGNYSSIKNLNTTDEITLRNDRITFSSSADRVYYQGELTDAEIPWDISVRYYLDGTEYSPEELAGASGALEICFDVMKNENCGGNFYDTFALQATFTLDTEICSDIQAEGATVANVGKNKQLTYTILPGNGISAEITADVVDFEMEAVSLNGIRMSLNPEIDDGDLTARIRELTDAIAEVDDGTEEIRDGAGELQESVSGDFLSGANALDEGAAALQSGAGTLFGGAGDLSEGASSLASGADALDDGIQDLNTGIAQVQAGLDALEEQTDTLTDGSAQMYSALRQLQESLSGVSGSVEELEELVSASSALKQGISDLSDGAEALESSISYEAYKSAMAGYGLDIDAILAGNASGVSSIETVLAQTRTLRETLAGNEAVLASLGLSLDTIDQYIALLEQTETLLNGNTAAIQGMESYLNAVNAGAAEVAAGAAELRAEYAQFDAAIGGLADTLTELLYEMAELRDAVDTLAAEYENLGSGLNAYTEGVAQVAAGCNRIADGAKGLASGSSELASGSHSLYSGTTALLGGMEELGESSADLKTGTAELKAGTAELLTGIDALYDGLGELKDGTEELRAETDGMDTELEEQIDAILDSISGGDEEVVSFVSKENTAVRSVQFVIQTEAIEIPEAESASETVEELNFRQRVKKLFGR